MNRVLVNPIFYLFLGHGLMIGVGCVLADDIANLGRMFAGLVAFALGWGAAGAFQKRKYNLKLFVYSFDTLYKMKLIIIAIILTLILSITYIYIYYGLPALADNPSIARLKQREYLSLMLYIEYASIAMMGIGYLYSKLSSTWVFSFATAGIALLISALLSVRYIFLEGILLLIILNFRITYSLRSMIGAAALGIIAIVFFGFVQYIRSNVIDIDLLMEILFQRFFMVHYEIFYITTSNVITLDYPTYLTPIAKLLAIESYNTGFLLYNALEKSISAKTQGYAPVSLIGEVFLNFGKYAYVFFPILGFLYHIAINTFKLFVPSLFRPLFSAFVCVALFRIYAHSAFGSLLSIALFSLVLYSFGIKTKVRPHKGA